MAERTLRADAAGDCAPPSPLGGSAAAFWIVAADAGRACILRAEHRDGVLTEVEDLLDSRLQRHEAKSDRAGSVARQHRGGSAFEPRQSFEEHVAEAFAKRIGEHLGKVRQSGEVDRIYRAADPAFLGRPLARGAG